MYLGQTSHDESSPGVCVKVGRVKVGVADPGTTSVLLHRVQRCPTRLQLRKDPKNGLMNARTIRPVTQRENPVSLRGFGCQVGRAALRPARVRTSRWGDYRLPPCWRSPAGTLLFPGAPSFLDSAARRRARSSSNPIGMTDNSTIPMKMASTLFATKSTFPRK